MGIRRMLTCFRSTRPQAFVGVPLAHAARPLFPKYFKTVKIWVTVGRRWFWRGHSLKQLRGAAWKPFEPERTTRDETAAILFTTGSTGPAKGAV
jgi:acyl-coenzyme A synthetase/AMP-(fatty) acid ligase